jgi:hypothetical protein
MRLALRAAVAGQLEQGCWLFFAGSEEPTLDTPCLLLDADSDDDPEVIAAERGFP